MHKFLILILFVFLSGLAQAKSDVDQWKNSEKTYKDLINEGFEIKSYNITPINSNGGLIILLFVTVLQKNKDVFECQEYQNQRDQLLNALTQILDYYGTNIKYDINDAASMMKHLVFPSGLITIPHRLEIINHLFYFIRNIDKFLKGRMVDNINNINQITNYFA